MSQTNQTITCILKGRHYDAVTDTQYMSGDTIELTIEQIQSDLFRNRVKRARPGGQQVEGMYNPSEPAYQDDSNTVPNDEDDFIPDSNA